MKKWIFSSALLALCVSPIRVLQSKVSRYGFLYNGVRYVANTTDSSLKAKNLAIGIALHNTSFADYEGAFAGYAKQVDAPPEFLAALRRCLASGGHSLVELRVPSSVGKLA